MSRGPGRVEQAIETLFTGAPSQTFSTDELIVAVYRGVNRIEKKHRVAVLRAADKVAKRLHWKKWKCERCGIRVGVLGRGSVYHNMLDLHSYAIGRLRVDNFHADMSIDDLQEELHSERYAKYIQPGGSWWLHVEENKAKAGLIKLDRETERMLREHKKGFALHTESLKKMFKTSDDEREQRHRQIEANKTACQCGRCGKDLEAMEPVARITVKTYGGFFGRPGPSLIVQCLDCAGKNYTFASGCYGEPTGCAFCGREVYDRWRVHRRRSFCCETCRQKWKARNPAAPSSPNSFSENCMHGRTERERDLATLKKCP